MLSIIIPVRNSQEFIGECLRSIFTQQPVDAPCEVLISDNCSTDQTMAAIEAELKGFFDLPIPVRVFKQEKNLGAYGNLNFLLDQCAYAHAHILCADDYFSVDTALRSIMAEIRKYPQVGIFSFDNSTRHRGENHWRLIHQWLPEGVIDSVSAVKCLFCFGCFVGGLSNITLNVSQLKPTGFFDPRCIYYGDVEFYTRAALAGTIMRLVGTEITYRRLHDKSISNSEGWNNSKAHESTSTTQKLFEFLEAGNFSTSKLRYYATGMIAHFYYGALRSFILRGSLKSLRNLIRAHRGKSAFYSPIGAIFVATLSWPKAYRRALRIRQETEMFDDLMRPYSPKRFGRMQSSSLPKVSQIVIGRFHHFHLARQLERLDLLETIFTGYPRFKLRKEHGIPAEKIQTFPWLHAPFMGRHYIGLTSTKLTRAWAWRALNSLDRHAARNLGGAEVLIALSGSGLKAGREIQSRGGSYICDRGSAHIRVQNEILREEYQRLGLPFVGTDPRIIAKEEEEYEVANRVTVPSEFARQTFLQRGFAAEKICKVPYGVRLDLFQPLDCPKPKHFTIIYVGRISVRKGFIHLLEAFEQFKHPGKRMIVAGRMEDALRPLLRKRQHRGVEFRGHVPNEELPTLYSEANICVLPSIEDGFGMAISEALACGCPVIASENTGGSELLRSDENGYRVPIRNPQAIVDAFARILENPLDREAVRKTCAPMGWDEYGDAMHAVIREVWSGKPTKASSVAVQLP